MTRPLRTESVASLAFGLGLAVAKPDPKRPPGLLSGIASELDARGVWSDFLDALGPGLRAMVVMRVSADANYARASAFRARQRRGS